MEKVRAKFTVVDVVDQGEGEDKNSIVKLNPVTSGSAENKEFYKWTPGGVIELSLIRPETAKFFKPGDEIYVDFTKAVPPAPSEKEFEDIEMK